MVGHLAPHSRSVGPLQTKDKPLRARPGDYTSSLISRAALDRFSSKNKKHFVIPFRMGGGKKKRNCSGCKGYHRYPWGPNMCQFLGQGDNGLPGNYNTILLRGGYGVLKET